MERENLLEYPEGKKNDIVSIITFFGVEITLSNSFAPG